VLFFNNFAAHFRLSQFSHINVMRMMMMMMMMMMMYNSALWLPNINKPIYMQGCSPKKEVGTPETRLRQRF